MGIVETGCIIDGSHMKTQDFLIEVIELAVEHGFEINMEQFEADVQALHSGGPVDDDELIDILDALDWTYDDALSYLNNNAQEGYCWFVEDQSLFLEEVSD